MAIPVIFTQQPYKPHSDMDVRINNFNAVLSIINMVPLFYLGLQIISHYFCPTPITMNANDPNQELQVDPPQVS